MLLLTSHRKDLKGLLRFHLCYCHPQRAWSDGETDEAALLGLEQMPMQGSEHEGSLGTRLDGD